MSEKSLVCQQLEAQHPLHGVLGRVWDRKGGEDFVADWADENPGAFIKMVMACTPSMQPMTTVQGDVVLHVHPSLAPTALDVQEREVNPDADV
jgi:hypothetical protein